MRRLWLWLLILLPTFWVSRFCQKQTDGFTLLRIHPRLPNHPAFTTANPPLPDVFSQPFSYLRSGGQAYAFVSADERYVLKFFKHHRYGISFWHSLLPSSHSRMRKKEKKRIRDLSSYQLAMEALRNEAALLYVHLHTTSHLNTCVVIRDKLNIAHTIDLDQVPFILQRKAIAAYTHIDKLIDQKRWEEAQQALVSICELVVARCKKGIDDEDPRLHRNVGFIDNRAILIDIGRLKRDCRRLDPSVMQQDLATITQRLQEHLAHRAPQLAHFLSDYLENHTP